MTSRPWIGPRFLSLFGAGRPALSWELADHINQLLVEENIQSIGVTGSLCPSVLTAVGYGAPDREINAYAFNSRWSEGVGWNCVVEDSPGMEKEVPWSNPYLPVEVNFWDGATPFFTSEAMFIDLPFSHNAVHLRLSSFEGYHPRLLLLGFLESYDGPEDVLEFAKANGYEFEEMAGRVTYAEKSEELSYRLITAYSASRAAVQSSL